MVKKAATKRRPVTREHDEDREQREYRARLARAARHADAVNRLTRQIGRAIDRNDRALRELAQMIADRNGDTIIPAEPSPVIERPASALDAARAV